MKSFLEHVVDQIFDSGKDLMHVKVVLPSQRSCVFLKKHLISRIRQPSFLPEIITISSFVEEIADLRVVDTNQLLFEFYEVYRSHMGNEQAESFDMFTQWAYTALADFSDIDSYLVETDDFFSNLSDVKRMNTWFKGTEASELSKNYIRFFERMGLMYSSLYKRLKENGYGYKGMLYREASENLEYFIRKNNQQQHVFLAGFNALNKAEEAIFQEMLQQQMATAIWDAESSIMDADNEAGSFLRTYKETWKYYEKNPFLQAPQHERKQEVISIGAPKNVAQAKYLGSMLEKETSFESTAVVTGDERVLPLVLSALPKKVDHVNITMGYPLKNMPVVAFTEHLFLLHLNQRKFDKLKDQSFYFKDVISILSDPFLQKFSGSVFSQALEDIRKNNRMFVTRNVIFGELTEKGRQEHTSLFQLFKSDLEGSSLLEYRIDFLESMLHRSEGLDYEYLKKITQVFIQLNNLNSRFGYLNDLAVLYRFFKQMISVERLDFRGEPLVGLQVMGMLESRALDFETLFITSVNEGFLPGKGFEQSFIPVDIRKYFHLPVQQDKDAIYSYHFQRLISRSKKVFLIYNTESDGYGSGEKSRYITRLKLEGRITTERTAIAKLDAFEEAKPVVIKKNEKIIRQLQALFRDGISPSALSTYLQNPLKFYEYYVLGIREQNDFEETVAFNTMGSIVHDCLELLYEPFLNRPLKSNDVEMMLKNVDTLLPLMFEKHFKKGVYQKGKNKLIFEVCRKYLVRHLNQEKQDIIEGRNIVVRNLEKELRQRIEVQGIEEQVWIRGKVDRIDTYDETYRIIDYKTGAVSTSELNLNDLSSIRGVNPKVKGLQVMMYAYLLMSEQPALYNQKVKAGILSFKRQNQGLMAVNFAPSRAKPDYFVTQERQDEFLYELSSIIKEILNPDIPFTEALEQ